MIGVVTEGPSDKNVVQEICRKERIRSTFRLMRGNNFTKAKRYSISLFHDGCNKVIVLKDLHRSTSSEIETKFIEVELTGEVKLCIAVRAIESWLLADEWAFSDYLGIKVKTVHNPEEILKPDEFLNNIFKKTKDRPYIKGGKDPAEIAKRLRLNVVEKRCPSFKEFMAAVQN